MLWYILQIMTPDTFSPEQRQLVKKLLRKIESDGDEIAVGHAVAEVSLMFNMHPLVVMEQILREMGSETYLIAVPFDEEISAQYEARMPHSDGMVYPYYLHACVDGPREAKEVMRAVETTTARNLIDLANTGLLTRKRG